MRPAAPETVMGRLSGYPSLTPTCRCWQERRPQTKNRRSISDSAKCDRRACRSNTRTLRAQPTQYRIERNASCQRPDQYATLTTTYSEISTARRFEIQRDATEELFQAERPGLRQAGLATVGPPKPATLGHCLAVEDERMLAVAPSSIDGGATGSRLQADHAP
jgi:hypothetical protein